MRRYILVLKPEKDGPEGDLELVEDPRIHLIKQSQLNLTDITDISIQNMLSLQKLLFFINNTLTDDTKVPISFPPLLLSSFPTPTGTETFLTSIKRNLKSFTSETQNWKTKSSHRSKISSAFVGAVIPSGLISWFDPVLFSFLLKRESPFSSAHTWESLVHWWFVFL